MSSSDDYDLSGPHPRPRPSILWPVLAVVGLLSSVFLLLVVVGLGAVVFTQRSRTTALPKISGGPLGQLPADPLDWDDPNAGEPSDPPYPLVADLWPQRVQAVAGEEAAPAGRLAA